MRRTLPDHRSHLPPFLQTKTPDTMEDSPRVSCASFNPISRNVGTRNLINGIEEHEVEFITRHRLCGCSHQYLVKWKGYPTADNTWEPKSNLEHAAELLKEYKDQHAL
jgi:hypothetical protein